jgi:hypothetical protein
MAVFYNIGILLALAFWPEGAKELYSTFDPNFSQLFRIDLSNYVLGSDQRSARDAIAHDHHPARHFICLRHFLSSLKNKLFSFEVDNLVKARSGDEFESVKVLYDTQIPSIEEPQMEYNMEDF